jgi:hypothetical protein
MVPVPLVKKLLFRFHKTGISHLLACPPPSPFLLTRTWLSGAGVGDAAGVSHLLRARDRRGQPCLPPVARPLAASLQVCSLVYLCSGPPMAQVGPLRERSVRDGLVPTSPFSSVHSLSAFSNSVAMFCESMYTSALSAQILSSSRNRYLFF